VVRLPTGWTGVDDGLLGGGLACGAVHEWFGVEGGGGEDSGGGGSSPAFGRDDRLLLPPLAILSHLAFEAVARDGHRLAVWVGRRCRPYLRSLVREGGGDRRLLHRSIFVDPANDAERLWAIDLAARCLGVAAVVADGSGLDMAASRRLQLAAQATGGGALVLLARPACELATLSAAATRWRVVPVPPPDPEDRPGLEEMNAPGRRHGLSLSLPSPSPRWTVELLRCKGVQPLNSGGGRDRFRLPAQFTLEFNRAKGTVAVPADVVDQSRQASDRQADAPSSRLLQRRRRTA